MSAPNVEAVPVSGRNRCGLMLTVKSTGERCTISELARRAGVKVASMQYRWRHAGRPSVIDDDMLRPAGHGGHRDGWKPGKIILEYPPHGRVTFRQIAEVHKDIGKSLHFFRDRWHRAGRPAVVSAALFDHPDMRRIKDRTVPVPTDPKYLDDSLWSPDVPYADLCHLSGRENTGAGKGATPDEEWIKMHSSVRCVLAGLYRRIPAAGTGGD